MVSKLLGDILANELKFESVTNESVMNISKIRKAKKTTFRLKRYIIKNVVISKRYGNHG